ARLNPETTFLGFAGSPWTVATYMVAGQGGREQADARQLGYADPGKLDAVLDAVAEVTVDYLSRQIECGVDAVQLFDSWAGSLSPAQFERYVVARTAWIVNQLRERHPDTPIIGFPKGAGGKLRAYAAETGVDAIGLDETVDPAWAARELPAGRPVRRILDALGNRPHIFNLGHGIQQTTPIEHVEQLVALVKG